MHRKKSYSKNALLTIAFLCFLFSGTFQNLPKTEASSTFSIKTGYYYGDGVPVTVSGLPFKPEVVIIKSDSAAGQLVWKSSAMPESVSSYLGVAIADNTENEITFTNDGFTVSSALEVNTNKVRYVFIAFAGNDCTTNGTMCIGKYNGTTAPTQSIVTGFQPDLVWVKRTTAVVGTFQTSSMGTSNTAFFSAAANNSAGAYFQTLDPNGFTVGTTNNTNAGAFYYVAFKSVANKLAVGSFLGDGLDNKNIDTVGFEPDFVLVKQNSALVPAFNTTECFGDYSDFPTVAAGAVNNIQELRPLGFQVGTSTSVNALNVISYWFAFGGAPDPQTSGHFYMQRGSYTGNGTSLFIDTPFEPNLVFIKGNNTQYAVWTSIMDYDQTHYFSAAAVAFTGGANIISGQPGFNIGNNTAVNTSGNTYEYQVFGNATTPRHGAGASDLVIGNYTGNGISPRSINHLGVDPDMVLVKRQRYRLLPT